MTHTENGLVVETGRRDLEGVWLIHTENGLVAETGRRDLEEVGLVTVVTKRKRKMASHDSSFILTGWF